MFSEHYRGLSCEAGSLWSSWRRPHLALDELQLGLQCLQLPLQLAILRSPRLRRYVRRPHLAEQVILAQREAKCYRCGWSEGGNVIYLMLCSLKHLWNLQRVPGLFLWLWLHFLFLIRLFTPWHYHHWLFVLPQRSGAQKVWRFLWIGVTFTK